MDVADLIEKGKIKRVFRARRKWNIPNLFYHITQRAAGKEPLFVEEDDYLAMLGFMKEACARHEIEIHAFCLMPNHIHLLLRPLQRNLSEFMRNMCPDMLQGLTESTKGKATFSEDLTAKRFAWRTLMCWQFRCIFTLIR